MVRLTYMVENKDTHDKRFHTWNNGYDDERHRATVNLFMYGHNTRGIIPSVDK